jgi:hypothetical protein
MYLSSYMLYDIELLVPSTSEDDSLSIEILHLYVVDLKLHLFLTFICFICSDFTERM